RPCSGGRIRILGASISNPVPDFGSRRPSCILIFENERRDRESRPEVKQAVRFFLFDFVDVSVVVLPDGELGRVGFLRPLAGGFKTFLDVELIFDLYYFWSGTNIFSAHVAITFNPFSKLVVFVDILLSGQVADFAKQIESG